GYPRIAQRAHEDGVKVTGQHGESIRRNGGAVLQVTIRRPAKGAELNGGLGGFHHFDRRGYNLFTDAVTRNHRDAFVGHDEQYTIQNEDAKSGQYKRPRANGASNWQLALSN